MIKKRLFWIITGLVALAVIALVLFLPGNDLSVVKTKADGLPAGKSILVSAWPEAQGVQKGDAFLYVLEVLYDPTQVSGVDRESLDDNVNLSPFEVRGFKETTFNLDSKTRVYQRLYEIQLITGNVEHLYEFPSIVVRYKLRSADGYAEASVTPVSVYIAPRLPDSGANIISGYLQGTYSLQPTEGNIKKTGISSLAWIFWLVGALVLVVTVIDLYRRVIPQWKESNNKNKKQKMSDILSRAYRSLNENVANGARPRVILHQVDHILRVVLSPQEQVGWLEEPNINMVPDEIRQSVISLFAKCQAANGTDDIKAQEVEKALQQLEEILKYYFTEDMESWKN